jgi:hypothetical protein
MIVNTELEKIRKNEKMVVACREVLSRHLPGRIEEHEKFVSSSTPRANRKAINYRFG